MLDSTTKTPSRPLAVTNHFSDEIAEYVWRDVVVSFKPFVRMVCRVPAKWSDNAAATLMSKYAVRAGVPDDMGGVDGREVDAERIFDRLVAGWRAAAIEHGYWQADDPNLAMFCAEIKAMLEQQVAAPNSPQWFNTGVAVQYGITAGSDGHYYATVADGTATAHECNDSLAHPQISACFIQSVNDSLVGEGGIMDLWTREARLFKYGSGSGSNVSNIRGKNEPLSRGGASSGLLSFLRVGDQSAGAIKSAGTTRRAAKMIIVDDDHPDIEAYVDWKPREDAKIRALHAAGIGDPKSFEDEATETVSGQNANNSVAVSDAFMHAVINDEPWDLHARVDGRVMKTVQASELWAKIVDAAWQCADPGLQFRGTLNAWHTCKADGEIRGSNPCSEYVFLDDTACNLASLNLAKFCDPGNDSGLGFDFYAFEHAARLWTIVLDISVSMAGYPTAEIARRSMLYRTLGLGYAALGEMLVMLGYGYGTQDGREIAAFITSVMTCTAYRTSAELAAHLGAFPRYHANASHMRAVLERHVERSALRAGDYQLGRMWEETIALADEHGVRNAQVTLLAPCGTIGIVMDCETTGIEPYYSDNTVKQLSGGGTMHLVAERFAETLREHGHNPDDYTRRCWTIEDNSIKEYVWTEPPPDLADVLVCASTLTPKQHVDMMAAVQPFLSSAISKTVNMPSDATREDVAEMYTYAWRSGLKSIAIYRDGCKPAQPLQGRMPAPGVQTFTSREAAEQAFNADAGPIIVDELVTSLEYAPQPGRGERELPPDEATARRFRLNLGGHTLYLTLSEYTDGRLAEIFVTSPRTGSTTQGWVNTCAKLFSLALQHGTPLDALTAAMRGEQFEPSGYMDGRPVTSPVDAFARIIEAHYLADDIDLAPTLSGATPARENKGRVVPPVISVTNTHVRFDAPRPTGNACDTCGSFDLKRSGACFVCGRCGSTTGCS